MSSDFLSLADWGAEDIVALLDLADRLKQERRAGKTFEPLRGKTIALLFEKPSLRTRMTFETGMFQLGGNSVFMETRLGERETVPDMARNLERWVDGIVARTHSHEAVVELARFSSVPVINALTDKLHPCQVLADAMTVREHKGTLDGIRVAFVGDGNNMLASWAHLATRVPIDLCLTCPPGFEIEDGIREFTVANALGSFAIEHDPVKGVENADVIYTDVWTSMGLEHERQKRLLAFKDYQVNAALMQRAKPGAVFMHCLPAHRGEEVTDEVMESSQSIVFDQAENRLHAQKAVMVQLMGNGAG